MTGGATARLLLAGLLLILMAQANATDLSFFNEIPSGNRTDINQDGAADVGATITQRGRNTATLQQEELSLTALPQPKGYANQADIIKLSRENLVMVSQYGAGNYAGIFQKGGNNTITLDQDSDYNRAAITQYGVGNNAGVTQSANLNAVSVTQIRTKPTMPTSAKLTTPA